MGEIRMPHDALVLVGGLAKALFRQIKAMKSFRSQGSSGSFRMSIPTTHEQAYETTGRAFSSADGSRRSGLEDTDWTRPRGAPGSPGCGHRTLRALSAPKRSRPSLSRVRQGPGPEMRQRAPRRLKKATSSPSSPRI